MQRKGTREGALGRTAAAGAIGYAIGSFPTADIVARLVAGNGRHAVDLRESGTRNPGARNAAKMLGAKWGALVLAGDLAKGAVASFAGRRVAGDSGAYAAGTGAVFGHCLPAWSGFRGGKGVATSAGTTVVCFPVYMPIDALLAASTLALSRGSANAATYVASAAFTCASLFWWKTKRGNLWGPRPSGWLPLYAAATSVVIAYKFLITPEERVKMAHTGEES